jgi:transposase-like protein
MSFPTQHRTKLHSINPLERLVGIFPNEHAIARLIGAILLEQNEEWPSSAPATSPSKASR